MPHANCTPLVELKYRNQGIRLFNKESTGDSSKEIWISFEDITKVLMKNSTHAKSREEILGLWKNSDKIKTFILQVDNKQQEITGVSQTNLIKLIFEAGSSDAFADWITKSINAEMEKIFAARLEEPLRKEIDALKQQLEKWKGGKQDTVYILNFYPYDDGIYKIGLTDKIERRVADLNTGTPSEIIVEYNRDCGNKRIVEQMMHYVLEKYRVNPNKEFFRIPKHIAVSLLDSVVDFIDGMHEMMSMRAKGVRNHVEAHTGHKLMAPEMFIPGSQENPIVLDDSGDLEKMINSFSVLSINRTRSTLLPDLTPMYPQAVPYVHGAPEPEQPSAPRVKSPESHAGPRPQYYQPPGRRSKGGHQKERHSGPVGAQVPHNTESPNGGQYSYFGGNNSPSLPQQEERKHKWFWQ